MAETIKKRISDLDAASQPLGGTELAEISQGGVSKKVTLTNIFGSGWWAALRAAFSSFVAPEATHAIDSDTVGGETKAQLHDATKLTGAVPLASIPAELTGKNAATATVAASCSGNAATATNALACSGNAATATVSSRCSGHGYFGPSGYSPTMYSILSPLLPNVGDWIPAVGKIGLGGTFYGQILGIERRDALSINIITFNPSGTDYTVSGCLIGAVYAGTYDIVMVY